MYDKKHFQPVKQKILTKRSILLGGLNSKVEVDATVLSRRGVIKEQTTTDVNLPTTVWFLGAINRSNKDNFFSDNREQVNKCDLKRVRRQNLCWIQTNYDKLFFIPATS